MIDKIPHKKKIAVGTLIAVAVFLYPHAQRILKWYVKVEDTRDTVKDYKHEIERLNECERKATERIIRLEAMIEAAKKRIDKLEYKIDRQ